MPRQYKHPRAEDGLPGRRRCGWALPPDQLAFLLGITPAAAADMIRQRGPARVKREGPRGVVIAWRTHEQAVRPLRGFHAWRKRMGGSKPNSTDANSGET